jgi:hypothetical protein
MGQLITYANAADSANIYFKDTRYSHQGRKYVFEWPNVQYPTLLAIHYSHSHHRFGGSNGLIVDIREWIEDNIQESVILDSIDLSYKVVRKDVNSWERWDRSHDISNIWNRFHFRKDESALAFKLKFGKYISPVTTKSPDDDFNYDEYELYK